jgi:hypothetical protein
MAVNLAFCTVTRLRTLTKPVLVMHVGALLTMAGAVTTAFGYIATVNIYEGAAADTVYRWDQEQDVPFGVSLNVRKIVTEYYPVRVQVGVLAGGVKVGLFKLKTGQSFPIGNYLVQADEVILPEESLKLSVFENGRLIGSADTEGAKSLPPDFPYDFKLVAYGNPVYKKVGVDLALLRGEEVVAEGLIEQNNPLIWNGLSFYHTELEKDEYGNPYAGIQIVKDPGQPIVYAGFAVLLFGASWWSWEKLAKPRRRAG